MPRKYAPRRRPARKPRARRARGPFKGKAAANTKVDLVAKYRIPLNFSSQLGINVPTYAYSAFTPCHSLFSGLAVSSTEFQAQKQLFDEYCITSMKVTYSPLVNVNNSAINLGDPRVHTIVDRDGNTPIATSVSVPNKMQAYDSYKEYTIYRKWSRTLRCKNFWMDTGITGINPQAEAGTAQPWVNAGMTQVMAIYCQELPASFPVGTNLGSMTVEWTVKFRGKKTTAFGYDPVSGSVILTPITSYPRDIPVTSSVIGLTGPDEVLTCVDGEIVVTSSYSGEVATASAVPE